MSDLRSKLTRSDREEIRARGRSREMVKKVCCKGVQRVTLGMNPLIELPDPQAL